MAIHVAEDRVIASPATCAATLAVAWVAPTPRARFWTNAHRSPTPTRVGSHSRNGSASASTVAEIPASPSSASMIDVARGCGESVSRGHP